MAVQQHAPANQPAVLRHHPHPHPHAALLLHHHHPLQSQHRAMPA